MGFARTSRLLLVLAGPVLGACGDPVETAPPEVARASVAPDVSRLTGLDPAAMEALQAAATEVDRAPDSTMAWNDLATRLHAHTQLDLAKTCYQEVLRRAPQDAQAVYRLALIDEELGHGQEAFEGLERAAALATEYAPAHWRLGLALFEGGQLERAEDELRRALAIVPGDAAASVGLARVQLAQEQDEEAARTLEEHLLRHPDDANARFHLGTAYRRLGRVEEATRALAGSTGGEPLQDDPWMAEVMALRTGQRSDFLSAVERLDRGEIPEATRQLETLLAADGEDVLVLLNLQRAYRMSGRLDEALALLERARAIDPTQDLLHVYLAGAQREKARSGGALPDPSILALALESARQAVALSPTFASAHGMLGDVLNDLARREEATASWCEAARLGRGDVMWQEKAGQALCLLGRWAEAVPFLQQWDTLRPDHPQALLMLSAALANSGQLDAARVPMERLRTIAPDDPVVQEAWQKLEAERRAAAGR
jgi:tetratricopeptide (TPR) repeat protein